MVCREHFGKFAGKSVCGTAEIVRLRNGASGVEQVEGGSQARGGRPSRGSTARAALDASGDQQQKQNQESRPTVPLGA